MKSQKFCPRVAAVILSHTLERVSTVKIGKLTLYAGCQISDLLTASRRYNKDAEDGRVPSDQEAAAKDSQTEQDDDGVMYSSGEAAVDPMGSVAKTKPNDAELKVGRLIWPFVIAADQISVGRDDEWRDLSFDELMSLPEERPGEGQAASTKGTKRVKKQKQPQPQPQPDCTATDAPKRPRLPRWRPRLYVPIEMVWKALTGHGIDYRRVPALEWQALVAIGSSGEDGILQGDLGRVTGQDKRSVPRRTDFLAAKGYIAKRTHMTRGSKTSKLWLAKFAPELPGPANPLQGLDMSPEVLTRDMEPVPWMHQWVDNKNKQGTEEIAYMALGHTILALIKAWGVLRVRDLKKKLGVVGLRWQMKVMSRMLRRFDAEDYISYVAATFVGHNFVFKDCVKFVREPTDKEWRMLLATGKKSSSLEDGKSRMMKFKKKKRKNKLIKQNLKQSKDTKLTKKGLQRLRFLMKRNRSPPRPSLALWNPDKPLANTISEYIFTGGAEGYTAQELCRAIASSAFYHYFHRHLKNCSEPGIQPETLTEFQMSFEPVRTGGRSKAFTFTCAGASNPDPTGTNSQSGGFAIDPALAATVDSAAQSGLAMGSDSFGFMPVDASAFEERASGLTDLVRMAPQMPLKSKRPYNKRQLPNSVVDGESEANAPVEDVPRRLGRPKKVKRAATVRRKAAQNTTEVDTTEASVKATNQAPEDTAANSSANAAAEVPSADQPQEEATNQATGRPSKKRKAAQQVSYLAFLEEDLDAEQPGGRSGTRRSPAGLHDGAYGGESNELEQDRSSPGVYLGEPGSLNRAKATHKKGRPRNSIVLIFRSDKLKDPDFLPGWTDYPKPPKRAVRSAKVARKPPRKKQHVVSVTPERSQAMTTASIEGVVKDQTDGISEIRAAPANAVPEQLEDSMDVDAQPESQMIGVQHLIAGTAKSTTVDEDPVPDETKMPPADTKAKKNAPGRAKKPKKGKNSQVTKWVCEKCGGEWLNDNGLDYHLKKGRNLCNPYYAEHPEELEALQKPRQPLKKAVLAGVMPDFGPSGGSAQEGGGSKQSIDSDASPKRSQRKISGKAALILPESAETDAERDERPVLKQRTMLQIKRLGASARVPRGVQASEAVAKETAVAKPVDPPQLKATREESPQSTVPRPDRAASTPEDNDEDLPYLKQIQPRTEQPVESFETPVLRKTVSVDVPPAPSQKAPEIINYDQSQSQSYPYLMNHSQCHDNQYPMEGLNAFTPVTASDDVPNDNPTLSKTRPTSSSGGPERVITGQPLSDMQSEYPPPSLQDSHLVQVSRPAELGANGIPLFRMPIEDYTADSHTETIDKALPLRTNRIQEIIKYLLDINGVFPTDTPLFWAVLKVYIETFEAPPYPSPSGCTRAVTILASVGVLKQATVAIRPRGRWKSINLIMQPEIGVTHPLVIDLKERIKNADPEMYIPPPFDPSEEEKIHFRELERPQKKRSKGQGRRDDKLPETVAELTAPFYAEQGIAGVRPTWRSRGSRIDSGDEENDERPRKRHKSGSSSIIRRRKLKYPEVDEEILALLPKKRRRGRKPRDDDSEDDYILEPHKLRMDGKHPENPGLWSLPPSFFSNTAGPSVSNHFPATEIQFLAPNTQLEDDYVPVPAFGPVQDGSATSPPHEPEAEAGGENHDDALQTSEQASFREILQLPSNGKGVWPSVPLRWFEKNDSSFTMKGWLPGQVDMLMENLPQSMEQMAHRITSHYKTETWADPLYRDFCTQVDGCRAWELSEQGTRYMSGSIVPNYVFINLSATEQVCNMAPIQTQWLDENEWTLETIPYEMLQDDDVDVTLKFGIIPTVASEEPQGRGRPQTRPRADPSAPRQPNSRRPQRDPNVHEVKVQRELTPYPQQPSDYFRSKGQEYLGVDWRAEDTRIAAYVAVSTLTGGINKAMDWGLMMRIFPESKLSNLRKFWAMIKKEREGFISTLFSKFQEEFLDAYEQGNLPPFNFENPLDYDWLRLIKWTLALVAREGLELPASREYFDQNLELVNVNKADLDWREMYHNWQRSVFNKFQDSTSEPASALLEPQGDKVDNDTIIARSWVRALCCTDADEYTPYEIRDKFLVLSRNGTRTAQQVSDLLETTICNLEHRRIAVKQKTTALTAGRPYKLNEHFLHTLNRFSNEDKFTVAAEFKLRLDAAFRRGEAVEIPWRTEDGMVMAAFNLQAHGRVRIEPVKRLEIPFGFQPGFYESRKFPKSYYRFDLQVVPTADYLYNGDIPVLQTALHRDNIPTATPDGKLPMWCDFFGRPDRGRWFKMLAGVLFVLATRGAMTDTFVVQALTPVFEEFEVGLVREWGLEQGLLAETTVSGGAATVLEWWWLVLGVAMLDNGTSGEAAGADDEAGNGHGTGNGNGDALNDGDRRRTKDQYAMWPQGKSRHRGNYRMF